MATTAAVKWDSKGNAIVAGARKKAKAIQLRVTTVAKQNVGNIAGGGVVGVLSLGIGLGIIQRVQFLRNMAAEGGLKRAAVITGTALVVAGLGMAALAKGMGGKKIVGLIPFGLAATAFLSLAPSLAVMAVEKIEKLVGGVVSGGALPQGRGPLPAMRERARARGALTPDEVRMAQPPPRQTYATNTRW